MSPSSSFSFSPTSGAGQTSQVIEIVQICNSIKMHGLPIIIFKEKNEVLQEENAARHFSLSCSHYS